MKNALLISILLLGINSLAYAGGDDRDQQLPLNSLNTEQINEDETPRFLDDDEVIVQDEATQKAQEEIEELIQTKLLRKKLKNSFKPNSPLQSLMFQMAMMALIMMSQT